MTIKNTLSLTTLNFSKQKITLQGGLEARRGFVSLREIPHRGTPLIIQLSDYLFLI